MSEHNLLFGVLALRLERISPEQLAEACIVWSARKDRPRLADLIVERGWIGEAEREEIERQLGEGDTLELPRVPPPSLKKQEDAPSLADIEVPGVRGGRYSIQRFHGEGGAGRVYVALDHVLNREVALKEAKPDLSHKSEARRRLLKEVQITGQLEHPGIVPIYDLARQPENDTPFYTMRLLRGETLQDAIADYHKRRSVGADDPLELPRMLQATISICNAISYAHSRGVIHRDLKPENAVLGKFGEVVLLDWGLAKLMAGPGSREERGFVGLTADASARETAAGIAVGTPAYMAPEQVDGKSRTVDLRTDVYGLGAILFELLTGRAPHVGEDSAEVLSRIVSDPTPRVRDINPSAPPALEAVCAKAMAKDLDDRYANASQVADELQRYLVDEPVHAYRGGLVHRIGRWARRNRAWTMAGAAALFITIAVVSTAAIRLGHMAGQEREARERGLSMAAKFGAGKIAFEIDLRWHYLKEKAADPYLRRQVRALDSMSDIAGYPGQNDLEDWLRAKHEEHSDAAKATSWFLLDSNGRHLGRSPAQAEIVGQDFAYRDYFHGKGRDFDEGHTAEPIRDFHRSVVFKSKATDNLIVAFTTPVWDGEEVDGDVIGVLGMTVELGTFGALQTNLGDDQLAVLVETKRDWVQESEQTGLVLHHPGLADASPQQSIFRLGPELVDRLQVLRQLEVGRKTRQGLMRPGDEPAAGESPPFPLGLDRDYRDPIGGRYAGTWLAAFEPVIVNEGSDTLGDTGWIVIVQERMD